MILNRRSNYHKDIVAVAVFAVFDVVFVVALAALAVVDLVLVLVTLKTTMIDDDKVMITSFVKLFVDCPVPYYYVYELLLTTTHTQ